MNFLFYDYETLSQDPATSPVVCLALCLVDTNKMIDDPYTLTDIRENSGYAKFKVEEQVKEFGKIIQSDTLSWWKENVDKETRDKLLNPSEDDVSIRDIPSIFSSYLAGRKLDYVYTRGNTFDPIITKSICDVLEVPEPYAWWVIRDTRSFLDGALWGTGIRQDFKPKTEVEFKLHDPVDDIALDILRFQTVIRNIESG